MGRPGTAAVAAAGASTTERLAKFAAETAAIPAREQGKVGAAVQTATAAGLVAAPVVGAVAAGKFLAGVNRMVQRARKPGPWICAVHERQLVQIWPRSGPSSTR